MDNLEKFIKDHRRSLDRYEPSPELWTRIINRTGRSKKKLTRWLSAAAMITVILGAGITAYTLYLKQRHLELSGNTMQTELRETEYFYNTLLNTLYSEAEPLLSAQPEIGKELKTDMDKLDQLCEEIKKDLNDNIASREVIEALIRNYTIKIRLLEDMLATLKADENNKKNSIPDEL